MKILRNFWPSLQETRAFHHKEIPIPMLSFKSNRNIKSFLVRAILPPSLDYQTTHLPLIKFPSIHHALTLLKIWRILKLSITCDYTIFSINLHIKTIYITQILLLILQTIIHVLFATFMYNTALSLILPNLSCLLFSSRPPLNSSPLHPSPIFMTIAFFTSTRSNNVIVWKNPL